MGRSSVIFKQAKNIFIEQKLLELATVARSRLRSVSMHERIYPMISFDVKGMSCGHCVKAVTQAILALDASAKVQVDLAHSKVNIDTSRLAQQALEAAITEAGYEVVGRPV